MKVILNKDLAPLGEEGDVKEVARGYARNFLFPRGIAMPYTERTVAILESRREEIEERKEEKRKGALGIKEKLEELDLVIVMPAGANGRLYGAVTSQTVADELAKQGFEIERKRIELSGNSFKSVGKYKVTVKLYESAAAELGITVEGQQLKVETPSAPARRDRRRREESPEPPAQEEGAAVSSVDSVTEGAVEASAPEPPVREYDAAASSVDSVTESVVEDKAPEPPVVEDDAVASVADTVTEGVVEESAPEPPVVEYDAAASSVDSVTEGVVEESAPEPPAQEEGAAEA
jgi:large subunit ribosomal protein L9